MLKPDGRQKLGNYYLIRHLGSGGFADVFLGEHIHLKTQAAIKVLRPQADLSKQERQYEQFLQEAQKIANLRHNHIVSVLEFGIEQDEKEQQNPFLVMDFAQNGTLRDRHPMGSKVPLATILSYVQQIAEALDYVHKKIIHRDIKPANMLVGATGDILLSDFGIAITAHSDASMTAQAVVGTYVYMPW